jgi:hypothetical protein
MPSRALPALIVSETERHELEQLIKRPSTPQQLALRAKIILPVACTPAHPKDLL